MEYTLICINNTKMNINLMIQCLIVLNKALLVPIIKVSMATDVIQISKSL